MRTTARAATTARSSRARRGAPAAIPLVGLVLVGLALRAAWGADLLPPPEPRAHLATTVPGSLAPRSEDAGSAVLASVATAATGDTRAFTSIWDRGPEAATGAQRAAPPEANPASDPATIALSAQSRLPGDLAARLRADPAIEAATVVRAGYQDLVATWDAEGRAVDRTEAGWRYPIEVLAVEPAGYAALLQVPEVLDLGPGEALLSASSAVVRQVGVGGRLRVADGTEVRVAGVLPDPLVGAAEVLVTTASPLAPTWEAYVLARRADAGDEEVLRRFRNVAGTPLVQVRGGEVPVLRHAPDLMAPARLKRVFGEFAISDAPGRWFQQDAAWQAAALERRSLPIVGEQTCHVLLFDPLTAALEELVERDLDHLLDPGDVGGCWGPRVQVVRAPSTHAWGISIDLNVQTNGFGATPTLPAEVVEVFTRHGFAWGGDWVVPDGMHFELVVDRPPGERWIADPDAGW
ncbi:MAG: M15 family metallopeptidase [Nitriliruptoraceae bacterium]